MEFGSKLLHSQEHRQFCNSGGLGSKYKAGDKDHVRSAQFILQLRMT